MDRDNAEGKLTQLKGKIKSMWGSLTDDDIALYEGQQDKFFGKVQEKYGIAKEEARQRIEEFERNSRAA